MGKDKERTLSHKEVNGAYLIADGQNNPQEKWYCRNRVVGGSDDDSSVLLATVVVISTTV